nr:porin [uncultured Rhodoferax sp.]
MKKTLIALAALAASGVALAQVTVTGTYAIGYKQSSNAGTSSSRNAVLAGVADNFVGGTGGNAAGESSGLGIDTSSVTFAASEDLGSGMKIAASMNIDTLNRASVVGGDSSLKLTTSVGRLTLQTYKPVDYLSGGISGVGGAGLDDKVFSARVNRDAVGFDTKLGPVFVGYSHLEAGPTKKDTSAALGLGVGGSGEAGTVAQRLNSFSVTYVGGPLIANLNYLSYDNRGTTDATFKDTIRTAGSYDAGFAKFGAGYSVTTTMAGATVTDTFVAASRSTGAWTFGANYGVGEVKDSTIGFNASVAGIMKTRGVNQATAIGIANTLGITADALNGTRSGYSLTAAYALSKRTSVTAAYVNWLSTPFAVDRSNEATLLLGHSF